MLLYHCVFRAFALRARMLTYFCCTAVISGNAPHPYAISTV